MEIDSTFLNTVCRSVRVEPNQYFDVVNDMFDFIEKNDGIGLAANQVGMDIRLFVMCIDNKQYVCFNPMILAKSVNTTIEKEGCLSFPGKLLPVERNTSISASWFDLDGKLHIEQLDGLVARCFQHELDHLNGITIMGKQNGIKE